MRKFLLAALLAVWLGSQIGCAMPAFSGDPVRRTRQLIFVSENMRLILDEWERIWGLEMPNHTTPYRTHGGMI